MRKRIERYIRQKQLCTPNDKLLVALSGGADSVALLRLLLALGYRCETAHCNFHLRDEESNRDEAFVRQLCEELGIPLHMAHFDTAAVAGERRISIEMAARELRYTWFEEVRRACGATCIAVAHHRDDSVETLLLNLLRGTGINGLRGIRPKNGAIIRPLLCVSRREITDYLERIGQPYVTDSTNLTDDYTRNKIRHRLLPLMEEINPSIRETLLATAHHLDEAALIYNKGIEEARKQVLTGTTSIDIHRLLEQPAPGAVLYEILHPLGFNEAQVNDIRGSLQGPPGKSFVSERWRVVKDRDCLLMAPLTEARPPLLAYEEVECTPPFHIPDKERTDRNRVWLDADKLKGTLSLRPWQQGDRFVPFGMKGTKLVSDYLTDRKFSLLDKERQWVLCSGEEIVWLVGERADNRFRVDETTQRILIATIAE